MAAQDFSPVDSHHPNATIQAMTTTLNRKPVTLANRNARLYRNLWQCAGERARQCSDNERAGREYQTADAMWSHAERCKVPAFQPSLPDGITPSENYSRLTISRAKHIESALNGSPLTVPDYLSELMTEEAAGWRDRVANWLSVNDDRETQFTYFSATIGAFESDLSGEINLTWFTDGAGDQYWQPFYAVVDGEIYDCRDSTIGDCCILDDTIGWYATDLSGNPLPDDCQTDRLLQGYSSNPTCELETMLLADGQPVWHWGFGCFVARLQCWPEPVKLWPEPPHYSG